jgi:hypothetical protein
MRISIQPPYNRRDELSGRGSLLRALSTKPGKEWENNKT